MSTRKTTLFYALLIAIASLAVGMVIASRLGLSPPSSAQTIDVSPINSAPLTGPLTAETFRTIAKAQTPMVVNIKTEMKASVPDLPEFFGAPDDFFRRFFGEPDDDQDNPRRQREQTTRAAGSGFIVSKDGLILTNNHVVEDATKIEVYLYEDDEVSYDARVVGRDPLTDSALIQLVDKPDHPLPEARFGDSSQMEPGDWVMAIGNPYGFTYTVTVGVVSATKRAFPVTDGRTNEVLQIDAAINPGNSGGPLLNMRGEVIGMNTAIISNSRAEGNLGIGFAVPINTVRDLLPQLRQGKVVRGRIGVSVSVVPRDGYEEFGLKSRTGAVVVTVAKGGAAQKAGLMPGDVIVEYNGRPVPNRDELVKMVVATRPGTTVPVKVMRDRQARTLNVTVDELDLAAEQGLDTDRRGDGTPTETEGGGFGLTLSDLTPQVARRLQVPSGQSGALITDVNADGPAAGILRAGDVILSVNRKEVSNANEAARELQAVQSGRLAQLLLWRSDPTPGEYFVTVKKE
jgi:serine protease Do